MHFWQCHCGNPPFLKGLQVTPTSVVKLYEKDPKTLSEVIILVEKLHAAHVLTATLTASSQYDIQCWSMFSLWTNRSFWPPLSSIMAVMTLDTLHRTSPARFLPQEHHDTKTDLIQVINIPTSKGTDDTPLIMVQDMGDISAGQSCQCSHCSRSSSFRRHTLPSSSSHHTSSCHPLANRCPHTTHTMTPTDRVTPHSACATSSAVVTHATPQTRARLTSATLTALHRKYSQEKPNYVQNFQPPHKPQWFKYCHHHKDSRWIINAFTRKGYLTPSHC